MIGLSLSAIGGRPLSECLSIAESLAAPLGSQFLELAVGVDCHVAECFGGWPLVLHDNCLRDDSGRRRLDPLNESTWPLYRDFIEANDVLAVGVHAPATVRCSRHELEAAVHSMARALAVPVAVEVMPTPNRWCSSIETLVDVPLLLDVSHVLIWEGGDEEAAERTCQELLDQREVIEVHLSHNGGQRDSHELIPPDRWFEPLISEWADSMLVTYESLPESLGASERTDKRARRWMEPLRRSRN